MPKSKMKPKGKYFYLVNEQLFAFVSIKILVVPCDVCKEDNLENLVKKTIEHFGQIDVLVSAI